MLKLFSSQNHHQPFFGTTFLAFFFVWVASRSFMHKIKMAEITTASTRLQEQVPIFQLTAVS